MALHVSPEAVADATLIEIIRDFWKNTKNTSPTPLYREGSICPLELEARIVVAVDLAAREPIFEIPIPRAHLTKAKSVRDSAIVEAGNHRTTAEAKEQHADHCAARAENRVLDDAHAVASDVAKEAAAKLAGEAPFYESPVRSKRAKDAERVAMTSIAQEMLDAMPGLYAVLQVVDDFDRTSGRPDNTQATISQALEWLTTAESDLATEVARRVVIAHLRASQWAPDWARALYFPQLAARIEGAWGNDLPQHKRRPRRKPQHDQIVGFDAIAATIGRTSKTAERKIWRGEIPAAFIDGEYVTRQAFVTVDRTRLNGRAISQESTSTPDPVRLICGVLYDPRAKEPYRPQSGPCRSVSDKALVWSTPRIEERLSLAPTDRQAAGSYWPDWPPSPASVVAATKLLASACASAEAWSRRFNYAADLPIAA
jgi:hypothetical protein